MNELGTFIIQYFWHVFFIISILLYNRYKKYGFMLLFFQILFGYKWWFYLIAIIVVLCHEAIYDLKCQEYKDKLKKLESQSKDYDYK